MQYVLLQEAIKVATLAGDPVTALRSIDEFARHFDVDGGKLKEEAFEQLAASTKSLAGNRSLADAALDGAQEALKADDFETAAMFLKHADVAAQKARATALATTAASWLKELELLRSAYASLEETRQALKTRPDDPQACLKIGKYLCLARGDWDAGLPYLAKGSDAKLKALAEMELAAPADPADKIKLADGWWDAGESESPATKLSMQRHAYGWYQTALADRTQTKNPEAEKRVFEFERFHAIRLLSRLNPKRDAVAGKWLDDGKTLVSEPIPWARVQLPCIPSDEYVLRVRVERKQKTGALVLGLPIGESQVTATFDGWSHLGFISGLQYIDGKSPDVNETRRHGKVLQLNQPADIVCIVRRGEIIVTVNGNGLVRWKGDSRRLSVDSRWAVPNTHALFVGSHDEIFVITGIDYIPVVGRGRLLE
jgi:hypothetical protein